MHKKFFKTASVVEAKDEGVISGYASVFNKVDSYGDTIDPKAYDAVIASKELPIMLFGHDSHSVPIGKWVSLEKDEIGLKVTGQLNLNNAKAKEVFDAIKFGSLTGLSVGFSVNEDGYDVKDEDEGFGFLIKNIERLYEISVVPLPADNFARIAECKSLDLDSINDIKDLEINLRDVGLSRKDAKAFIAKAKSILSSQRDVEEQEDFNNEVNLKLQNILNKLN